VKGAKVRSADPDGYQRHPRRQQEMNLAKVRSADPDADGASLMASGQGDGNGVLFSLLPRLFLLTAMLLLGGMRLEALEEGSAKAVFVSKMANFLIWEDDGRNKSEITIRVVGQGEAAKVMLDWKEQKIGETTLRYVPLGPEDKVLVQDILFLDEDVARPDLILARLPLDHSTFVIGSGPEAIEQGAMMGIYLRHERLKFNVNQKRMLERGIGLGSRVLNLAEKVVTP